MIDTKCHGMVCIIGMIKEIELDEHNLDINLL